MYAKRGGVCPSPCIFHLLPDGFRLNLVLDVHTEYLRDLLFGNGIFIHLDSVLPVLQCEASTSKYVVVPCGELTRFKFVRTGTVRIIVASCRLVDVC
jgi:hypothetical protein